MANGKLTIRFDTDDQPDFTIDVGTLETISNFVMKKGSAYPIVTQGVQNSFPIENGNSQSYTFQFKHTNGQDGLTNAVWYNRMVSAIDRWQARTDGCKIIYTPNENGYAERLELDGYIKSLTLDYKNNYNEVISGNITFTAGRMHIGNKDAPSGVYPYSNMYAMISDSTQSRWYAIYYGAMRDDYSCINSISITAGPECPFEYAMIRMPRKKLMEQIPDLVNDLVDNKNKVYLNLMGNHNMFAQAIKSSGDTITIKAYCDAQTYMAKALPNSYSGTPKDIIEQILMDASLGVSFAKDSIMFRYNTSYDTGMVTFPPGTLAYRALQICAKLLRCRLFFADNKAWIIDYTASPSATMTGNASIYFSGGLILRGGKKLGRRCTGDSSCDETGFDPVRNHCTITYSVYDEDGNATQASEQVQDDDSIKAYGPYDKGTISLPELTVDQARTFASNMLYYIREPQRSMTFTLKEVYGQSGKTGLSWKSFFTPCAMASSLQDDYNSESITNDSQFGGKAYHKLILSEYTREFPKGTCEYTFGMIASVELSDNLSQIGNTLNS